MKIQRFDSPATFYEHVQRFLLLNEAEHNLMLGVIATLLRDPEHYPDSPYMAVVKDHHEIVLVALRTPPYNLQISLTDTSQALEMIIEDFRASGDSLPGVIGRADLSLSFAQKWAELMGQAYRQGMVMRIFRLDEVIPVEGVAGSLRQSRHGDRRWLKDWIQSFHREALGDKPDDDQLEHLLDGYFKSDERAIYVWEVDGKAVSIAANAGPTPHGARVTLVYTPPEYRKRGYASACVAALSQSLLDGGRQFCFLFTDRNNPTSNHIYQQIGYRFVCDVDAYSFTE